MKKIIRITRHPIEDGRERVLRKFFGDDVSIIDDDTPYGGNPVETVVNLIKKHGGNVVAIELVAPITVLARLTKAKRELGHIIFLRAEFKREGGGRPLVCGQDIHGRDIFEFDHYDIIKDVVTISEPLNFN